MTKKKTLLLVVLSLVFALCCAVFAGCGGTKYKVEWKIDGEATVAVEGETELPKEVKDGTELVFTVTPADGYAIESVKNGTSNVIAKDGKYTVTVTKDVTINVKLKKLIESVAVTKNPTKMTYNAGDALDKTGMEVTVTYKNGDKETTTAYSFSPANFSAGDKAFTVSYGGVKSAEVALDATVEGKITLNLAGGHLSNEELAKLPANRVVEDDIISWTYAEPFAEDFVLPAPTKLVGEIEFPFLRWSGEGIENNTIAKDTAVNITATVAYETKIVELTSLQLLTEKDGDVTVPYLVLKGEFKAANEVYLYLYEGNDKVELKGPTITKQANSSDFTCKFDLRELAATGFTGKWMDIKMCTQIGNHLETQEIDLNNYADDFLTGSRSIIVAIDGVWHTFEYQYWTPKKGDGITGAPGTFYEGTENLLKIQYLTSETAPDYYFNVTTLEVRNNLPYVVIKGECLAINDKDAATEALTDYIKDMQNFSNWSGVDISQTLTINDDLTFEIAVCIDKINDEGSYIMHAKDGDFNPSNYDVTVEIKVGNWIYSLSKEDRHGWGWAWTCVKVVNAAFEKNKSVIVENNTPYFILMGKADGKTAEEIKATLTQFDFEDETNSSNKTIIAPEKITVTVSEGFYTVKVDISELAIGKYWIHAVGLIDGNGDVHPDASKPAATANGRTYKGVDDKKDWGIAHLLSVEEA